MSLRNARCNDKDITRVVQFVLKRDVADVVTVTPANVKFIVKETFWYLGSSPHQARLFCQEDKTAPYRKSSREFLS